MQQLSEIERLKLILLNQLMLSMCPKDLFILTVLTMINYEIDI